jgi:acetyl esterase/lipase
MDDVVAAVRGLIERGQAPERIGIVAESAGAAIALSAALRLRDEGIRLGAFCFLSPWTDLALTGRSAAARSVTGESPISMESMAICAHLYLQGMSPLDPTASPVYANLRGLAPMLIQTSRTDSLHDDACLLAERAHEAGVDATLRVWSRGSHVFERLFDSQSERAIAGAGDFLRRHLTSSAGKPAH